jgi:hypothetical protein
VDELHRLWDPSFWDESFDQADRYDRLIEEFNDRVGLL